MIRPGVPSSVDRHVLQSYLDDHLAGASAGRARARRMSEWYADLRIGPALEVVADQIDEEHAHLADLIDVLGLRPGLPLRVVARIGEAAGRLKPNGRGPFASPVTPMLELELLRSAVNGKQGLWQVLAEYADDLGLERHAYLRRVRMAEEQEETLERLHAELRPTALRPDRQQP